LPVANQPRRVEQAYAYPEELRDRYRRGKLFREWYEQYRDSLLFYPRMFESAQIPHSGPIRDPLFFHELFLGTRYLDAGYGALFNYRAVEHMAGYEKVCEILGCAAAEFVTPNNERGGRPPDLLVYDRTSLHFRLVECKGRTERLTTKQPYRFLEIEEYLDATLPKGSLPLTDSQFGALFPRLGPGQWIHVARLEPR
jgi:hypothetical protein